MVQFDLDAARLYLRLLEYLRHVVDRAVRHARSLEQPDPLPGAALAKHRLQQAREFDTVFHALAVIREARIVGERRTPRRFAELAEQVVVAAGKDHVAVGGLE